MLTKRTFHHQHRCRGLFPPLWPRTLPLAATITGLCGMRGTHKLTPAGLTLQTTNPWGVAPQLPCRVLFESNPGLIPGDIHVDALPAIFTTFRTTDGAMRYGMWRFARGDLYEPGTYSIQAARRKADVDGRPRILIPSRS